MKKIFLILFIVSGFMNAQEIAKPKLSGMLFADSKISFDKIHSDKLDSVDANGPAKKSPFLAAAMSAVVPGAGEVYNGDYLKAAIFVAVEATAITFGLIYNKKGDDQTTFFQNFAEQHWSVKRYALWTITNAKSINSDVDPSTYNVFKSDGNVDWGELNRLESDLGSYYSHRLAYHGEQQYFEMIGKYPQFNPGWDDFGDENTPYVYGDPLTAKFLYYSKERGKANDFYNVASKAVIVIVTNNIK